MVSREHLVLIRQHKQRCARAELLAHRKSGKGLSNDKEIARLMKAAVVVNPATLFKIPRFKYRTKRSQILACDEFKLRAQSLDRIVSEWRTCSRAEDKFFTPFLVSGDLEEAMSIIKTAKGSQRKLITAKLKKNIRLGLKRTMEASERRRSKLIREVRNLPEFFTSAKFEIERAIVAQLNFFGDNDDDVTTRLMLRRFKENSEVRIGKIVDDLSSVYSEAKIRAAFAPDGMLFRENYLLVDYDNLSEAIWTDVKVAMNPMLLEDRSHLEDGTELFQPEKVTLPEHKLNQICLSDINVQDIKGMIELYKSKKIKSLSLMLYGASGTGKTSLAHAVAHELGMRVVTVSAEGLDEESLPYVVSFLSRKHKQGALILFDECESLWYGNFSWTLRSKPRNSEKGALKQVLEKTSGLVVFTSNVEPPEAFRRRVSYVLEMKRPNPMVRSKLLRKEIESFSIETGISRSITDEETTELAARHDLTGGFYRQALMLSAVRGKGELNFQSIDQGFKEVSSVFEVSDNVRRPQIKLADLVLTPEQLTCVDRLVTYTKQHFASDQVSPLMPTGVTVLFEGPSGTGKTALAEALAHKLDLRFRRVTPSTFLSKWVGETEEQIRTVLKEAEEERYLLFLDEAEGMLSSREGARANWERTQIDEWLNRVEQFRGIFVAATNHKEMMDHAFGRRFLFKVQFSIPVFADRVKFLKQHLFDMASPAMLEGLGRKYELSFGELRSVVVQAKIRTTLDAEALEEIMSQQMSGRSGIVERRLGI